MAAKKALFMTEQELVDYYGEEVREVLTSVDPTATHISKDKKMLPMWSPDRVKKALDGQR